MALAGDNDMQMLQSLSAKTYIDQAKWFLNAYYEEIGDDGSENVWKYTHGMIELDEKNGKEGNELEEFYAHKFLETFGETLTVRELREQLKEIDIDTNKYVSISEYLIFRFKIDWHALVHAAQSDNKEEIDEATRLVQQAQSDVADSQSKRDIARQKETEARDAERQVRAAEEEVRKAEEAQKAALAELEAQEKAQADKLADLERRSEEGGIVSRNRAKNELEQAKAEDPLPLQRAKINQGATVRASEKASARAAELSRQAAEKTTASEAATADAEAAVAEAQDSLKKAEDFLQEVKSKPGSGKGAIWWLEREMLEARKYMPQRKGGITK